jgi:hypothetical protein
MTQLDFNARYTVERFGPGIAFWLAGYVKTPSIDEETGEEVRIWLGDCDEAYDIDTSMVEAIMVGDDIVHIVDVDELTVIEGPVCSCGQVGCGWHGEE